MDVPMPEESGELGLRETPIRWILLCAWQMYAFLSGSILPWIMKGRTGPKKCTTFIPLLLFP